MNKHRSWFVLIFFCLALFFAVNPVLAQKMGVQPTRKPKADPVKPLLLRAENEMAAGNSQTARKTYEEAFRLDKRHDNNAVNIGLAKLILEERLKRGENFDLTPEQLQQRFQEVPFLAEGFCHFHLGDKEGAKHAWNRIIEWRNSDELVQYLHELKLDGEVRELKTEMGIDSGTGSKAQKTMEEKYRHENKWEGAFQIARKRLVEIPVGSKAEQGVEFDTLTQTCMDYFFKQANPNEGLRKMAGDLYQQTKDHQRVLLQILDTHQIEKTSFTKVRSVKEAEEILRKRVDSLEKIAGYLETLAQHPTAPVSAEAVATEP